MTLAVVLTFAWFVGANTPGASKAPTAESEVIASTRAETDTAFSRDIHAVLKKYCLDCHSTELKEGELDLERFSSMAAIRRDLPAWQKVAEMLHAGEMPPKTADQPTANERALLTKWVRNLLDTEARADAGDPGPVVLRRLCNAEYSYTIRDLTGVATLDPAREFPVDSAAGEGFTNTGGALVMSPALFTKYLDAAKGIADHAVFLPDGVRFSAHKTRRDWTNELVDEIRRFYGRYTDDSGATRVNLQGVISDTNAGGRLPLARYLAATIEEREALTSQTKTIADVAAKHGLSSKYLSLLWKALTIDAPSPLLGPIRTRWKNSKSTTDAEAIAAEIARWHPALWKLNSVGHIGKIGGPTGWLETQSPVVARQEFRVKLPPPADGQDATIYLAATDATDGREHDFVVWENPRLVAPGRPDLALRDVREVVRQLHARRARIVSTTAKCLSAAAEAIDSPTPIDVAATAKKYEVDAGDLSAWLAYLGIGTGEAVKLDSLLTAKIEAAPDRKAVTGWGTNDTPSVVANSSDELLRIPGDLKPHSVVMHPSPTLQVAAGWRSPASMSVRVQCAISDAHASCGNGVTWHLELRRGGLRRLLASGVTEGARELKPGPFEKLALREGDLIALVIGPRDGSHVCDLTAVDLTIIDEANKDKTWNLARDVSDDLLAGNPHADRFGNKNIWHFYTEPATGIARGAVIPAGSILAQWQSATNAKEREKLAAAVQTLLAGSVPADKNSPDHALHRQLTSLGGPLLGGAQALSKEKGAGSDNSAIDVSAWGIDPKQFGRHPSGEAIDAASLCVQAPSVLEIRLPAELVEGCELVTAATLHQPTGREGSVQAYVGTSNLPSGEGLRADAPILTTDGSAAHIQIQGELNEFRELFPAALCYVKIVPVDEVVTLTLFHREDDHLQRLMLDDAETARLDHLWNELRFVSQDAFALVDAFEQLLEYASQDGDPKLFEPLRKPLNARADALRASLLAAEPKQIEAILAFAARAYRRPLAQKETAELKSLYAQLRKQNLPHEDAARLLLARVLVSPAFLYKLETPGKGRAAAPVSDWELASRLSYFLWSTAPDEELLKVAATGRLRDPEILKSQTRRMLADARARRLATEFACQWLHIYEFSSLDEKSERHFPSFPALRTAMYEESIQFLTDLFQRNGSIRELLDADHTFLNEPLAAHYGIPSVKGYHWRRVEGVKQFGRGGLLAHATTLAKQSGASRTSPILRGNWISEVLLGEKLPRPPKDVPQLPEDESATESFTVRQLVEKHSSDPKCAVCHKRIDAYGFSLEAYDAIGRRREKDLAGRAIDTSAVAMDGAKLDGLPGLRDYLLTTRREAFTRQFTKKLLGYALGRSVRLSDEPLLAEIRAALAANGDRVHTAIELIVASPQFQQIRGRERVEPNEQEHATE